jgi:hypothetical protein
VLRTEFRMSTGNVIVQQLRQLKSVHRIAQVADSCFVYCIFTADTSFAKFNWSDFRPKRLLV